ncbi:MAG: hypothetical protein ABSG86_03420 [Thermoguttaceae bacterium]|jgi:circadian clock protein KaiB
MKDAELVKPDGKLPEPLKKIIGDLSNEERVLVGLDLRRANPTTQ